MSFRCNIFYAILTFLLHSENELCAAHTSREWVNRNGGTNDKGGKRIAQPVTRNSSLWRLRRGTEEGTEIGSFFTKVSPL